MSSPLTLNLRPAELVALHDVLGQMQLFRADHPSLAANQLLLPAWQMRVIRHRMMHKAVYRIRVKPEEALAYYALAQSVHLSLTEHTAMVHHQLVTQFDRFWANLSPVQPVAA